MHACILYQLHQYIGLHVQTALSSTCLLQVTQNLTRWCCSPHAFHFPAWVDTVSGASQCLARLCEKTNSTDTFYFFFEIFILKNESGGILQFASHVSVLFHAAVYQSTLYSDPTSLKLRHRKIKSCNDFQYIDMDNNCIG